MQLNKFVLASFTALALVACGSGDDNAKPDDHKNELPPKNQACLDAGDHCKWDGSKWVVDKPGGEGEGEGEKPGKDEPPAADSSFDYSDIGVTDALKPERKGFAFYNKGVLSPLDAKMFKNVTQSPTITWSSKLEYDEDLYNFVAIRLADADDKEKSKTPIKFMFDKIGIENQKANRNINFFGKGLDANKHQAHTEAFKKFGLSSIKTDATPVYHWNILPAVVNTFMFKDVTGKWTFAYPDPIKKAFRNSEEDTSSKNGSGAKNLRVYGKNAFIENEKAQRVVDGKTLQAGSISTPETYQLSSRSDSYFEHVNYVWYDLSELKKRTQKATVTIKDGAPQKITVTSALQGYALNGNSRAKFPTDVELGVLQSVQFGRLTGEGIDPESEDLPDYKKENLKAYPFTQSGAAIAGNKHGEDWYFARGTEPTPLATLENFKSAGAKIAYDGQALMFGLDYKPTRVIKPKDDKGDQSTNAVKPADPLAVKAKMPLDGKQNFVRMVWDPASGEIEGSVYGVWTLATYWREPNQQDGSEKLRVLVTTTDLDMGSKEDAAKAKSEIMKEPSKEVWSKVAPTVVKLTSTNKASDNVAKNALVLEPWIVPLVSMKGKVTEGTNAFGGIATRVKDESKGLFSGAFFGKQGTEIGGVINSQTGNMKNKDLADPTDKWGGAFGAKYNGKAVDEDLLFADPDVNYNTSTEFFN